MKEYVQKKCDNTFQLLKPYLNLRESIISE